MADELIASLSCLHIEGAQSDDAPTSTAAQPDFTAIATLRPYQRALFEKLTARMEAQAPASSRSSAARLLAMAALQSL